MRKSAIIDETGMYRYSLVREWKPEGRRVCFVMLNPSIADASIDDPTIKRCIGFAQGWQFGSLEVVNLFAYRATNPDELKRAADPIGPMNDEAIRAGIARAGIVVAAWGTKGGYKDRDREVFDLIETMPGRCALRCLELTQDGYPKHPLYMPGDARPYMFHRSAGRPGAAISQYVP